MLQNSRKTLGIKTNTVYKIPPGGEVDHIQPVAYSLNATKWCYTSVYENISSNKMVLYFCTREYISQQNGVILVFTRIYLATKWCYTSVYENISRNKMA